MAMPAAEIEALIRAALPDADVVIEDLAGDGDHYRAQVTSATFAGVCRAFVRRTNRLPFPPPGWISPSASRSPDAVAGPMRTGSRGGAMRRSISHSSAGTDALISGHG